MKMSGLPLLVSVCQLEWSPGSSIASPEQFASISIVPAERDVTEWVNSMKSIGLGEAGEKSPHSSSSLSKASVP